MFSRTNKDNVFMKYKELTLSGTTADKIKTEIMYEVASAHIAGVELIRFDLDTSDEIQYKRTFAAVTKILKAMKSDGVIQFFATPASMESYSMEAQFLFNKYSEYLSDDTQTTGFVYVRT